MMDDGGMGGFWNEWARGETEREVLVVEGWRAFGTMDHDGFGTNSEVDATVSQDAVERTDCKLILCAWNGGAKQ